MQWPAMNEKMKSDLKTSEIQNLLYLVKTSWHVKKARVIGIVILGIVSGINAANTTLFFKLIIEQMEQNMNSLLLVLTMFLLVNLACNAVSNFLSTYKFPEWNYRIEEYMTENLLKKYLVIDQRDLDRKEFYDLYAKANREAGNRAVQTLNVLQYTICNLASAFGVLGIIVSMKPILIVLAIVPVFISLRVNLKTTDFRVKNQNELTASNRKISYIIRLFTTPEYFEEVRTKDYTELSESVYDEAEEEIEKSNRKWMRKSAAWGSTGANLLRV